MAEGQDQTTRPDWPRDALLPHWRDTLPEEDRAERLAAWRARRSCADCRHWDNGGEDPPEQGGCNSPGWGKLLGALMVPADFTCEHWEAA